MTGLGEAGVLRQETIARMDGVDFVTHGHVDDAGDVEVRAQGLAGRADAVGLVGLEAVQSEAVFVSVNRDGANAQLMRGAEDANGDFAAVGNHQLFNHAGWWSQNWRRSDCILGHSRCIFPRGNLGTRRKRTMAKTPICLYLAARSRNGVGQYYHRRRSANGG